MSLVQYLRKISSINRGKENAKWTKKKGVPHKAQKSLWREYHDDTEDISISELKQKMTTYYHENVKIGEDEARKIENENKTAITE